MWWCCTRGWRDKQGQRCAGQTHTGLSFEFERQALYQWLHLSLSLTVEGQLYCSIVVVTIAQGLLWSLGHMRMGNSNDWGGANTGLSLMLRLWMTFPLMHLSYSSRLMELNCSSTQKEEWLDKKVPVCPVWVLVASMKTMGGYHTVLTWYQLSYMHHLHHVTAPRRITWFNGAWGIWDFTRVHQIARGTWVLICRGLCRACEMQYGVRLQEHLVLDLCPPLLFFCEYPINKHLKIWYLKAYLSYIPYKGTHKRNHYGKNSCSDKWHTIEDNIQSTWLSSFSKNQFMIFTQKVWSCFI